MGTAATSLHSSEVYAFSSNTGYPFSFLCCQHNPFLILAAKRAVLCYTFRQRPIAYKSTAQFGLPHVLLEKARLAEVRIVGHRGTTVFLWSKEMKIDPSCPRISFVFHLYYLWLDCSFLSREKKTTNKQKKKVENTLKIMKEHSRKHSEGEHDVHIVFSYVGWFFF